MKTIFLILICIISLSAQTQNDLRKNYGTPVSESYEVSPNILATFSYSKQGKVCGLTIEPKQSGSRFSQDKYDLLTQILDELVPIKTRGENIINGFLSIPGEGGTTYDYENLKITRHLNKDGMLVFVGWKDKSCNNEFPKEFIFSTQYNKLDN